MFRQTLGLLLIATSLSACAPQLSTNSTGDSNSGPLTPISSTDGTPVAGSSCGSLSASACELLGQINQLRKSNSLSELIVSEKLALLTYEQARDMALYNYTSSDRPAIDGRTAETFAQRVARFQLSGNNSEMIVTGTLASEVMNTISRQESLRARILSGQMKTIGIHSFNNQTVITLSEDTEFAPEGYPRIVLSKNRQISTEFLTFSTTESLFAEMRNVSQSALGCIEAYIPSQNRNDTHCRNGSAWTQYQGGVLSQNNEWAPYDLRARKFVYGTQNSLLNQLSVHPYFPRVNATYRMYVKNDSRDPATIIHFRITHTAPATTTTTLPTTPTTTIPGGGGNPISPGPVSINTSDRNSVRTAYEQVLSPALAESMGFNGNVSSCDAGSPSENYRRATLRTIQFFRAMVGLPTNITANPAMSASAQQAALMMAANGQLSHSPPNTWRCYSTAGAGSAGASNLALGASGPGAIMLYIDDFGSNNYAVGHRRWIFYPALSQVGLGAVPGADALQVIGGWGGDSSPNAFVAWPSRGYFPSSLLPGSNRWSFSRSGIGLSKARVRMFKNGSPISVTLEPFAAGYGEDTLVWLPQGVDRSEATYRVIIDNLSSGGNIDYEVRVMGDL